MPPPFKCYNLEEFTTAFSSFPFTRKILNFDFHHTASPRQEDYHGESTIDGMWRYHTQVREFRDIAQHISLAPDGTIWQGRNWNWPPASMVGQNGNSVVGPFMMETIGNFQNGENTFGGIQKETALKIIVHVQRQFGLGPETLRFHRQFSNTACPGSSIDYDEMVAELKAIHDQVSEVELESELEC